MTFDRLPTIRALVFVGSTIGCTGNTNSNASQDAFAAAQVNQTNFDMPRFEDALSQCEAESRCLSLENQDWSNLRDTSDYTQTENHLRQAFDNANAAINRHGTNNAKFTRSILKDNPHANGAAHFLMMRDLHITTAKGFAGSSQVAPTQLSLLVECIDQHMRHGLFAEEGIYPEIVWSRRYSLSDPNQPLRKWNTRDQTCKDPPDDDDKPQKNGSSDLREIVYFDRLQTWSVTNKRLRPVSSYQTWHELSVEGMISDRSDVTASDTFTAVYENPYTNDGPVWESADPNTNGAAHRTAGYQSTVGSSVIFTDFSRYSGTQNFTYYTWINGNRAAAQRVYTQSMAQPSAQRTQVSVRVSDRFTGIGGTTRSLGGYAGGKLIGGIGGGGRPFAVQSASRNADEGSNSLLNQIEPRCVQVTSRPDPVTIVMQDGKKITVECFDSNPGPSATLNNNDDFAFWSTTEGWSAIWNTLDAVITNHQAAMETLTNDYTRLPRESIFGILKPIEDAICGGQLMRPTGCNTDATPQVTFRTIVVYASSSEEKFTVSLPLLNL